ncbi:MAG: tripartite tricarboxylate transporter TctB family protein, partial [Polyangiaceae bacterium]
MTNEVQESAPESEVLLATRPAEVIIALGLCLCGGVVVADSLRLGNGWAPDGPEAGFYPFYVGLVLCTASGWITLAGLRKSSGAPFVHKLEARRVASVLVPSLAYGVGIFWLGMHVASLFFLIAFMRHVGKYSWLRSVTLSAIIVAC